MSDRLVRVPGPSWQEIEALPQPLRWTVKRAIFQVMVRSVPLLTWEPVSGFEPLACRLQELRPRAPCTLAAQMARAIALIARAALGLTEAPVHEPVHDRHSERLMSTTERHRAPGEVRRYGASRDGPALPPIAVPNRSIWRVTLPDR